MPNDSTPHNDELVRLLVKRTKEFAFILLDTEGGIRGWNSGAEEIFGFPESEITGKPVSVLFTPEEREMGLADHELAAARAHGKAEDDRWLARRDGSTFWATGVTLAIRNEAGELVGFGKILRNRSDLWEQLETLRNEVAALGSSDRRKDVFLSTLSHELRNPLFPLSNAVQIMRKNLSGTAEHDYPLGIIERQVDVLRRLIDDMLDLSRIGAGKIELRKERITLNEVIHGALQSVGPLVRERRHALDVLLPAAAIVVEADAARLEQVFVNLLNNAAKYTPEGGRIRVRATTEGNQAVVHIEDNGVGIPHELLPRIFDLFTQAESSRGQSQGGLGIGLSLVKSLVALHDGSIQVRSDGPGKGSEFSVRLPFRSASAARP